MHFSQKVRTGRPPVPFVYRTQRILRILDPGIAEKQYFRHLRIFIKKVAFLVKSDFFDKKLSFPKKITFLQKHHILSKKSLFGISAPKSLKIAWVL